MKKKNFYIKNGQFYFFHCNLFGFLKKRRQIGLSIVEFAIILPLSLLLIFGIVEFGVLMYDKAMLTNASREALRIEGVVFRWPIPTEDEIEQLVITNFQNYCNEKIISINSGSTFENIPEVNFSKPDGIVSSGETISIYIKYNFKFLVFSNLMSLFSQNFQDGIPLEARTVMRIE